jgi:hypothetical protein
MKNMQQGALVLALGALGTMGCGGGDSGAVDAGTSSVDAAVMLTDSRQGDPDGGLLTCATKPSVGLADLSGNWVLRAAGAQVVKAAGQLFHMKSVKVALVTVTQVGASVTLDGHVCDRIQQDDPKNPAKVVIPDAWRLTEWPFKRSGTFSAGTLTLPNAVDVVGARLINPMTDQLPIDASDPRLVDDDNDGKPGITINLTGTFTGSLYCAQRDQSTLEGVAVGPDRVEGGMTYVSEQSVADSSNPLIKATYSLATSSPDPAACSSSFVMVKVPATTTCQWVRDNEATLF